MGKWKKTEKMEPPYLAMTRPETSSKTAALMSTMPTFVCAKSIPLAALAMTTNVVPRDVVERAAPIMKVSTAPREILLVCLVPPAVRES